MLQSADPASAVLRYTTVLRRPLLLCPLAPGLGMVSPRTSESEGCPSGEASGASESSSAVPVGPSTDDVSDLFEKEQSGLYRVRIFLRAEYCYILCAESTGAYQGVRRR